MSKTSHITNVDVVIGQRLRTLRTAKNITQGQLADKLEVTFQQIQKYEKGVNAISPSRICAIAQALNVSPEYFIANLINGAKVMPAVLNDISQLSGMRDGQALAKMFVAIQSAHARGVILNVAIMAAKAEGSVP